MCLHESKQVREKKDSLGRSLFAFQCGECHERLGDWIPHTDRRTKGCKPWTEWVDPRQARLFP